MRHLLFLCIALISSGIVQAQETKAYKMPRNIFSFSVNPDSTFLAITFGEKNEKNKISKTQQAGIFLLKKQQLTFCSKEFDTKHSRITKPQKEGLCIGIATLEQDVLTKNIAGLSHTLYAKEDGRVLWNKPHADAFTSDAKADLGMLLTFIDAPVNLQAIQLSTGKELWDYPIPFSFIPNLRGVYNIDESTALVIADQIYKVGREDGMIASRRYVPSPMGATISVFIEEDRYYVCDEEKIMCMDEDLDVLWTAPHLEFAKNEIGECPYDKSLLCLKNYGYVKTDAVLFPFKNLNKPFVAIYDKKTGKQLSQDVIKWDKAKGRINNIIPAGDEVYVAQKKDEPFQKMSVKEHQMLVTTEKGDAFLYDNNQKKPIEQNLGNDIFLRLFDMGEIICIAHESTDGNDYYLIDQTGKVVQHLPSNISDIHHVGNQLYYAIGNTLFMTEIK